MAQQTQSSDTPSPASRGSEAGHDRMHDHAHEHDHGPARAQDPMKAQNMMELQMIQQQLDELQKMLETVEEQLNDVATMTQSLDELEKLPQDRESKILVPVVRGMFAEARMQPPKTLKVHVGGQAVVEKSLDDAREMLEQQVLELAQAKDQLGAQQGLLVKRAQQLGATIRQAPK